MPELLADGFTSWDAMALRKSDVATIQVCTFEFLALLEPRIGIRVAKLVASNLTGVERASDDGKHLTDGDDIPSPKTVAVLALSSRAPIEQFVSEFGKAIVDTGVKDAASVAILDSRRISDALGGAVFDNAGNVKLQRYIDQVEEKVEATLLVGDVSPHSTWNRVCITHVRKIYNHIRSILIHLRQIPLWFLQWPMMLHRYRNWTKHSCKLVQEVRFTWSSFMIHPVVVPRIQLQLGWRSASSKSRDDFKLMTR